MRPNKNNYTRKQQMEKQEEKSKDVKQEEKIEEKTITEVEIVTKENLKSFIPKWKNKYGKIYRTYTANGDQIIWKSLSRKQYVEIMNRTDEEMSLTEDEYYYLQQEKVVKALALYPTGKELDKLLAEQGGLASSLS